MESPGANFSLIFVAKRLIRPIILDTLTEKPYLFVFKGIIKLKGLVSSDTSIHSEKKQPAPYRIVEFTHTTSCERRFIVVDRQTETPVKAASVYESHLVNKHESSGTRLQHLNSLVHMYSWAKEVNTDIDHQLLLGNGLTQPQIRSFNAWLRKSRVQNNGVLPNIKRRTINKILSICSRICRWFISQFARPDSENHHQRVIDVQVLIEAQNRMWKDAKTKVRQEVIAPDLSDDEIAKIESFLCPANRHSIVGWDIANRDYLIWRIAIELGLRIGEILALRLSDCPTLNSPYFRIVRIEERGANYSDPRKKPPRPKTLSRDLGFHLRNTVFPHLVTNYISSHRYIYANHKGRKVRRFILPHEFLIIARNGNPLSGKMADNIAHKIKEGTNVDFHWHLARHAFFNRAYAAAADLTDRDERSVRIADLVVWGGWQDAQSLDIYSRRARRERAKTALHFWQQGTGEWKALN